ncbi:potassium channel family protein [Nocardioides conyzicola]|uniref:Potassium channel domain-containing protein n=1 Tax=Nocardioides conyzicola TaxID=1651781 RepID=A0ABP8XDU8_9ACTN
MTGWKRWLRLAAVLAIVLVLYFTVPVSFEISSNDLVQLVISLTALGLLAATVLVEVRHQLVEDDRRIDGLVIALMVAVLGFALGFYVLAQRNPDQFVDLDTRIDALYFTMATLLTIGYGDVHATGQAARTLVLIQMVFNVVILATAASTITTRIRTQAEKRVEARRAAEADGSLPPRRRHERRTHRNPT